MDVLSKNRVTTITSQQKKPKFGQNGHLYYRKRTRTTFGPGPFNFGFGGLAFVMDHQRHDARKLAILGSGFRDEKTDVARI